MGATGPNVSSCASCMSVLAPTSTEGWKKHPPRERARPPPTTTSPPFDKASETCCSTCVLCVCVCVWGGGNRRLKLISIRILPLSCSSLTNLMQGWFINEWPLVHSLLEGVTLFQLGHHLSQLLHIAIMYTTLN